jgi:hypothetical protein
MNQNTQNTAGKKPSTGDFTATPNVKTNESRASTTRNTNEFKTDNAASFQEKILKQINELGDTIEKAGAKVEKSGWEKIGRAIHKLGDNLEHMGEKRPS